MLKAIALIILFFIVMGWFDNDSDKNITAASQQAKTTTPKERQQLLGDYMRSLEDDLIHIKSMAAKKHSDPAEARQHIFIMLATLDLYASNLAMQNRYDISSANMTVVREYRQALAAAQSRVLPILRDQYGPVLRSALWEQDITAKTVGAGYRTIKFVGGAFAANRNIKALQKEFYEHFSRLRFKRTEYKWYEGADDYTYYNLKSPDDADIGTWHKWAFTPI